MGQRWIIGERMTVEEAGAEADQAQGEIDIAARVVTRIAEAVIRQTSGLRLTAPGPRLFGLLARIVRDRGAGEGIRTHIHQDRDVTLDLWISADFGVDIPAVVADLQGRLATSINEMTRFRTRKISVRVIDLVVPPEVDESEVALAEEAEPREQRATRKYR